MKLCITKFFAISLALAGLFSPSTLGQTAATPDAGRPLDGVPARLHRQMNVLGDRMQATGKELSVYVGELADAAGNTVPAQVAYQLPGLVQLQGFRPSVLSFDGEMATGITSLDDELLLETFLLDLQEGMLTWARAGAAVRILGRGFGPDPRVVRNYTGPRYDVIEVTGAVPYREDVIRSKRYYFDSQTGLLQRTRYTDFSRSSGIDIETRFSQWHTVDSSAYPGRIEHYEGGRLLFSFTAQSITGAPAADAAAF